MAIWFPTTTGESYNITIKPMLQIGLTAYNFEPFKRQPFDLNLGINLFDKDNPNIIDNCVTGSSLTLESVTGCKTLYVPCEPNTTYTISKVASTRFIVVTTNTTPAIGVSTSARTIDLTGTTITITTGSNAKYICVFYYYSDTDTLSEQQILNSIMINKGSQALPYCNYFTPIELCKNGDYQEYLYNTGGKWFKHKTISKTTISVSSVRTNYTALDYAVINRETNDIDYNTYGTHKCYCNLGISTNKDNDTPYDNVFYLWKLEGKAALTSWWFGIPKNTSLADAQALLNGGIIYYILATPIEEEITDTTALYYLNNIKAFAQSYYGTTNIMITTNNAQPTMKVQTLDKIGG